jgi:PGF-pre-PGF domain-containing protein
MSCGLYLDGSYVASNSSVSNNGLSVIYYTPAIGNHNWYVYCNDSSTDYGNSSTFYFEMLPPYVPPSSPPSLPPEQKPEIIKEINFDEMKGASPNIAVIDIPNFPLDSISITPYTPVNNVKIYIGGREEITCKSLNIKRNDNITVNNTTSIVYDCVDLSKENISDDNLKEVEISFKIDGNWLTEKNINITSVRLLRYKSGNWQVLETEPISGKTVTGYAIANTTYIHFRAISPGLSPFVIAGQATTPITLEKVFSYYWLWILLIFIIILIIIYLYRRNKK